MKIIEQIPFNEVHEYDERSKANVRIGGYDMSNAFPNEEAKCYKAILEASDIENIYLLALSEFRDFTCNGSCRVADIQAKAAACDRVKKVMGLGDLSRMDLRNTPLLAPTLVCTNLEGPFTVIDGNHRITGQFLSFGTLENSHVIVIMHEKMKNWKYFSWPY